MSNLEDGQFGRLTGGDLVARTLAAAKVRHVFALHGGHLEAFYKACFDYDIKLVDVRHEASAGHAAEGYARATGGLGVCCVTAGPGFTNAVTAVVSAYLDASPTLFLVGSPPLREAETNALQGGFDQIAMATPGCKWAVRITNTERIPDLLAMAIRKATTGRRGSVLVELPIDVLHMSADPRDITMPTGLSVEPKPASSPEAVRQALEILRQAERPVIVVGGEARFCHCEDALKAFAEKSGIPVFGNKRGLGMLPATHPLNGHDVRNLAVMTKNGQGPDVALLLGVRLGMAMGGRRFGLLPADAKLIQAYSDPGEIGRIRDVALAIAADCGEVLSALNAGDDQAWPDLKVWSEAAVAAKTSYAGLYPEPQSPRGIHPFHAVAAVMQEVGTDAVFALDGGEAGNWSTQQAMTNKPGSVMTTGYLGCLGVAPGFAIGAQIGRPSERVVVISGDGAAGFNIQEFDTMVRHNLPIVTVILNNQIWGMSIHGQQILYGANYSAISHLQGTGYANIAAGFGCHAERVSHIDEVGPAVWRALQCGKPACVEVMTDPDVVSPATVAALNPSDSTDEVMIPYYENIPLR